MSGCFILNQTTDKIPKIIIQTWKTREIGGIIGDLISKLRANNPDFEYKFFTDEDIDHFIKTEYPQYYNIYNAFEYTIQKIDFFRYLCVYHYGGFYFDIDMDIDKSIAPLCEYECVFPKESNLENDIMDFKNQGLSIVIGNYAFGASTKNKFLKLCINNITSGRIKPSDIPNNDDRYKPYVPNTLSQMMKLDSYMNHILYTTGPVLVSQSYIDYKDKNAIEIIEPNVYRIYAFGDYGSHKAIGTWKTMEHIDTKPKIEQSDIEQSKIEQSDIEQPEIEQSDIEQSEIEQSSKIPKHIHQIWIGNKEQPHIYIDTWKNDYIAQNQEWGYTLWTEESIKKLFQDNIENNLVNIMYKLYNIEEILCGKADIARILILYYYGGIYIDADLVWINNKSLNPLIEESIDTGFFCALEPEDNLTANSVIGSTLKHKNLLQLMTILGRYEHTYIEQRQKHWVHKITGPYLVNELNRSSLTLFPSVYFYPILWKKIIDPHLHKKMKLPTESYMFQYGISTNNLDYTRPDIKLDDTNNILFSCTTFLKDDEKYKILVRTLDTFITHNKDDLHLINEFIILMEYSDLNDTYINELESKYTMMTFIKKEEHQKGQVKSLNMIIDKLADYKFWLHWEDSWYSTGPVLKEAFDAVAYTDITHYQLTRNKLIYDMPVIENDHIECKVVGMDMKTIKPRHIVKHIWRNWEMNDADWSVWKDVGWYPFFSLTPSMNKVSDILKTGYFSTDAEKCPFQFKFGWALKWVRRNNIVVGINVNIKVVRDDTHISTYTSDNYNKWLKKLDTKEKKDNYNRDVPYYTLKSDKKKFIIFWNPDCCCSTLKKLVYSIEEGFEYNGDDIHAEIGYYNYNKYFVEITQETWGRFRDYKKILVTSNNEIKIPRQWIDEIVDVKDIDSFVGRYSTNSDSLIYNKVSYSKQNFNIKIINLKADIDRKITMTEQFDNLKLEYSFFDAIDGGVYNLTDNERQYLSAVDYDINTQKGVVGCFLSHIRVLEEFIKTDDNYLVVVEDDIIISNINIQNIISNIISNINLEETSLIHLGTSRDYIPHSNVIINIVDSYNIYECNHTCYGQWGFAYLVTKSGCKQILDKYYNGLCNKSIDAFYVDHITNSYIVYPPLLYQNINNISSVDSRGSR